MSGLSPNKTPLGRLDFNIRNEICLRLRDRQSGRQINQWLAEKGLGPYTDVNYSNFRKTHYSKWIENQAKYDAKRAIADEIRRDCEARGESIFEKLSYDYAAALADARDQATPENIAKLAAATSAILNARAQQLRTALESRKADQRDASIALEREKFRWQLAEKIIEFAHDASVKEIAARSDTTQADKIKALLAYMDSVERSAQEE